MPLDVKPEGDHWVVYRTDTNMVKSRHKTKDKAMKSKAYAEKGVIVKEFRTTRGIVK